MMRVWATSVMLIVMAAGGCDSRQGQPAPVRNAQEKIARDTMKLTSPAFRDSMPIDPRHTGDGEDLSPPLAWPEVPGTALTLALICDDPDAPSPARPGPEPWVHWIVYNIPATVTELPAGIPRSETPDQLPGASQGRNSWPQDNLGYRGPAPPPGSGTHRYVFQIYALDARLQLAPGASKSELWEAMSGHILAEGKLIGTYQRTR